MAAARALSLLLLYTLLLLSVNAASRQLRRSGEVASERQEGILDRAATEISRWLSDVPEDDDEGDDSITEEEIEAFLDATTDDAPADDIVDDDLEDDDEPSATEELGETAEPLGSEETAEPIGGEETAEPTEEGEETAEPTGEGEETAEPTGEGEETAEPAGEGEETEEPIGEGEETAEPTGEGEETVEPTGEGEQTAEPTGEGEETVEPTGEGEETAEPTGEGEETPEPTGEGEETAEPTGEGEETAEPTGEGEETAEPTGEGEETAEPTGEATMEPTGNETYGEDDTIDDLTDDYTDDDLEDVDDDQPTWPTPSYTRTNRPTELYVPGDYDDDPVQKEKEGEENEPDWNNHHETPEEMLKDPNVVKVVGIAIGTTFGFMLLLSVCVAHQVQNNPDGCCASVCRLATTCTCCVFKILCFPCRMMCGSKSGPRHSPMMSDTNTFTHDLELS